MAIVYFDSSALVKLVVEEVGSDVAAALWDGSDAVATSGLAYPEVRAALAAAQRDGRITSRALQRARGDWEHFWADLAVVEPRRALLREAGDASERYQLRALDAVHLASAMTIPAPFLILAAWDDRLRTAAGRAGVSIAPLAP